jgi:beta-glucosidase
MEYWWGWDVIEEYFNSGHYEWRMPGLGVWLNFQDPAGKPPCDWWGINFYSRCAAAL